MKRKITATRFISLSRASVWLHTVVFVLVVVVVAAVHADTFFFFLFFPSFLFSSPPPPPPPPHFFFFLNLRLSIPSPPTIERVEGRKLVLPLTGRYNRSGSDMFAVGACFLTITTTEISWMPFPQQCYLRGQTRPLSLCSACRAFLLRGVGICPAGPEVYQGRQVT